MFHVATRRANLSRPNAWRFCVGPAGFKKRGVGFAGVGLWIRGFLLAGSASAWGWDLVFECLVSGHTLAGFGDVSWCFDLELVVLPPPS